MSLIGDQPHGLSIILLLLLVLNFLHIEVFFEFCLEGALLVEQLFHLQQLALQLFLSQLRIIHEIALIG